MDVTAWIPVIKDGGFVFATLFLAFMYINERTRNDKKEAAERESREAFQKQIVEVLTEVKVVVSNGNTLLNLLVSERK